MKIEPIIIGIPSWGWKKELVRYARKYPCISMFALKSSMCHECSRHFEMLHIFDNDGGDFLGSEYYEFYKNRGKEHKYIVDKVNEFYGLYLSIKKEYNEKDPPIITRDGCRLDGSHRMSILIHLGAKWISLNIARYDKFFKDKKVQKIKEQITQYRKDTYGLPTWTEQN